MSESEAETQNLIDNKEIETDHDVEGTEAYANGDECHICLKSLGSCNVAILDCRHIYCFSCILNHYKTGNNYCIVCNKPLVS